MWPYTAIKKGEIILFAGKDREAMVIMLNEVSQTEKDEYKFSHLLTLDLSTIYIPTYVDILKSIGEGPLWGKGEGT